MQLYVSKREAPSIFSTVSGAFSATHCTVCKLHCQTFMLVQTS